MLQRLVRSTVNTAPRPYLDRTAAVVVQLLVVVGTNITARKRFFEVLEEGGVNRHRVLEVPMNRAILDHDDLAVLLGDSGLDLADLFRQERFERPGAIENGLPCLSYAGGAQRVGLTRPAKGRLRLLIRLKQWLIRPLGDEGRVLADLVGAGEHLPGSVCHDGQSFFHVLNGRVHLIPPVRSGEWAAADTGLPDNRAHFRKVFCDLARIHRAGPSAR